MKEELGMLRVIEFHYFKVDLETIIIYTWSQFYIPNKKRPEDQSDNDREILSQKLYKGV